ncbi:MAG: hypothetical protein L0Y79_05755 [Chlorobi bacterium]|nr:hypothetical protein [Chlorobiota bacterium]MCI0717021.1 hypothetical protein [Chlorobiota bacterium]
MSILIYALCPLYMYSQTYKDTNEIKFSLNKYEYSEGEDIILKIEFDFNKGDSVVYFNPFDIISDVSVVDGNSNTYWYSTYLLATFGIMDTISGMRSIPSLWFPSDSIFPYKTKTITIALNKKFITNLYSKSYFPSGTYIIKFDSHMSFYWLLRRVTARDLKFKVIPKESK